MMPLPKMTFDAISVNASGVCCKFVVNEHRFLLLLLIQSSPVTLRVHVSCVPQRCSEPLSEFWTESIHCAWVPTATSIQELTNHIWYRNGVKKYCFYFEDKDYSWNGSSLSSGRIKRNADSFSSTQESSMQDIILFHYPYKIKLAVHHLKTFSIGVETLSCTIGVAEPLLLGVNFSIFIVLLRATILNTRTAN